MGVSGRVCKRACVKRFSTEPPFFTSFLSKETRVGKEMDRLVSPSPSGGFDGVCVYVLALTCSPSRCVERVAKI